ncbi:GGDEF domain-containing protein [Aneurinibacillus migulanus]|uniref:GGDEF domain-containing protein n=1 Tax=Aneurinibacillus migulanus TaxID=47500 RepID=UPI002E1E85EF|nr:GGDEF domain-containing protein [Aneurinibacillus migulanus]
MAYTGRLLAVFFIFTLLMLIRTSVIFEFGHPPHIIPIPGIIALCFAWFLGKKYDKALFYSQRDSLTHLYNRRFISQKVPKIFRKMDRKGEKLGVFVVDVNHFKTINDTYGHETGDKILKHISNVLLNNTKQRDIIARWGGDEFLIIVPHTDQQGMESIIHRVKEDVKNLSKVMKVNVSLSMGVSIYPDDGKELEGLIRISDYNMYELKKHSASKHK